MLMKPTRRQALQGAGALIVTFSISRHPLAMADAAPSKTVSKDEVDGFLKIDRSGAVTLYSGKVDLGTGVRTAMTQIVAEELYVPMSVVAVIEGDTSLTPDQGPTYGSNSIQIGGVQIRQAAATARQALLQAAAVRLSSDVGDLSIANGMIASKSGGSVAYGDLIGGKAFSLKLDPKAPTKDPALYKIVGQSASRLDIPAKVTAAFAYMHDFRAPGMLHGRVLRPPAIGANLESVDESSIRDVPGVVKVVREGNFLGVVAESEWGAIQASRRLKAHWSAWEGLPDQAKLWEHVRATKIVKDDVTSTVGDVAATPPDAKRLKATFDFAIHTHGSIGPSCSVVEISDGQLTCWSASQSTHVLRKQLAAMLSMPEDKVRCIYIDGSGCYGRNGHEDAAADAALLARAAGRPVRVQWMREDEHGWDPKGPPTLADLEAAIDAKGDIISWSSSFFIPQGAVGPVELVAANLAQLPPHGVPLSPGGIIGNSAIPYAIPNIRTVAHRLETTPFKPSWIRTPGRLQNTFANETFFDELAAAAGVDPLEYRLRYLKDQRGVELLDRLARLAKWERVAPSRDQSATIATGRGLAYVKYELVRTYVGAVADVEVNRATGEIRVVRFFVAQDCGQIINPDGVRNQIEGNVTQTVSRTLMEEVTFDRSQVTSLDWGSYRIIGFPEAPDVVIELIDRPDEKPWGSGEPSASVVPSAVSNAVFNATGARLRSVPFTFDKVKAALGRV
jgi:nicotinate dehydrogenase subunit B